MPPPTGATSASTDIVVNPVTGVAMTARDAPSDVLAKLVLSLKSREQRYKQWRSIAEAELIGRLELEGRRVATVGEYEISFKAPNQSHWDPDETEAALAELVDRGLIQAVEAVGVIQDKREVSRSAAKALLDRLHGPGRELLARCCTWPPRPPRFDVTESVQLGEARRGEARLGEARPGEAKHGTADQQPSPIEGSNPNGIR